MNDPINTSLGERLREARQQAGMTTAELAQALSISVDKLGAYETGVDRLPSSLLVRVCDLLQITPISLFQRKGARWH